MEGTCSLSSLPRLYDLALTDSCCDSVEYDNIFCELSAGLCLMCQVWHLSLEHDLVVVQLLLRLPCLTYPVPAACCLRPCVGVSCCCLVVGALSQESASHLMLCILAGNACIDDDDDDAPTLPCFSLHSQFCWGCAAATVELLWHVLIYLVLTITTWACTG